MKSILMIFAFAASAISDPLRAEEQANAASIKTEPQRRESDRLPTSVHCVTESSGRHVVTIKGIGEASPRDEERKSSESEFHQTPMDYAPSIPEISLRTNHENRTCTITTSRELNESELSLVINELAKTRSDIPCWAELESRDIELASDFRENRYIAEKTEGALPAGPAWFWLPRSGAFFAPFSIEPDAAPGTLLVVPTPVHRGGSLALCYPHFESRWTGRLVRHLDSQRRCSNCRM